MKRTPLRPGFLQEGPPSDLSHRLGSSVSSTGQRCHGVVWGLEGTLGVRTLDTNAG